MNTNDVGIFLVTTLAGVVIMILFIYTGNSILNFFKTPVPARIPRSAPKPEV